RSASTGSACGSVMGLLWRRAGEVTAGPWRVEREPDRLGVQNVVRRLERLRIPDGVGLRPRLADRPPGPPSGARAAQPLQRGLVPAQVGDELLERDDPDVTLPDRLGDLLHRLVGRLHVVSPQARRRAQQGDIRGGHRAQVKRYVVVALSGQSAAAAY